MSAQSIAIKLLVNAISLLSEDTMKEAADGILDVIENAVEKSKNTIDDQIVLPICKKVREAFNIEDND